MFTLEQLVRAEAMPKQSMYGLLWGVLANLVLDVLLIGVLRMGAAGSGWALMGTNVACIIYYMLFFDREEQEFFRGRSRISRSLPTCLNPCFR